MAKASQSRTTKRSISIRAVSVGVGLALFVYYNRFLFGLPCPPPEPEFEVLTKQAELDRWLQVYQKELGDDYDPYRNHCLRVLSYAKYSLLPNGSLFEDSSKVLGIAVAHHDIALWTDGELSYLEPSAAVMAGANHDLSDAELKVAHEIIMQHHKFTPWTPRDDSSFSQEDALLINAIRKGDWTDFTYGLVRYGSPLGNLCEAYRVVPDLGFHDILSAMGARLSPDNLMKRLDVLKIMKW